MAQVSQGFGLIQGLNCILLSHKCLDIYHDLMRPLCAEFASKVSGGCNLCAICRHGWETGCQGPARPIFEASARFRNAENIRSKYVRWISRRLHGLTSATMNPKFETLFPNKSEWMSWLCNPLSRSARLR
jgi:hypothetical protein